MALVQEAVDIAATPPNDQDEVASSTRIIRRRTGKETSSIRPRSSSETIGREVPALSATSR
jgi:hypothetical protein